MFQLDFNTNRNGSYEPNIKKEKSLSINVKACICDFTVGDNSHVVGTPKENNILSFTWCYLGLAEVDPMTSDRFNNELK